MDRTDFQKLCAEFEPAFKDMLYGVPEPAPVVMRIPKDHPGLPKIMALLDKLATKFVTPSGIEIQKQFVDADARVFTFVEALQEFAEDEGFDLTSLLEERFGPRVSMKDLLTPPKMGLTLATILGGGMPLPAKFRESKSRTRILERASNMMTG